MKLGRQIAALFGALLLAALGAAQPAWAVGYPLTMTSATYDSAGEKFGSAALSSGYGQVGSGTVVISSTTGFAIEAWVKSSTVPSKALSALAVNSNSWMGMDSSGHAYATVGGSNTLTSTKSLTDGVWHHEALSCASTGGCVLYVDGVSVGSTAGNPIAATQNVTVHDYTTTGSAWNGDEDEVALWNFQKYTANFTPPSAPYTGSEPDLVGLYHLDSSGADASLALATTVPVANTPFSYTNASAASVAPGSIGQGWTDVSGSVWARTAASIFSALSGTGVDNGLLLRPAAENAVAGAAQRVEVDFTYASGTAGAYAVCRYNPGGSLSTPNEYAIGASAGASNALILQAYSVVAGVATAIGNSVSYTATPGNAYTLRLDCVQASATISTVIGTLISSGSSVATTQANNAAAALQNISSGTGLFEYNPGTPFQISAARTFTASSAAATAYLISPPYPLVGVTGVASEAFDVEALGTLGSTVTVAPSDGGAGGTFSPSAVNLTSGATTAQFTYTPGTGSATISATNNGGLSNPASIVYSILTSVAVTSPAFHFSPQNWSGNSASCPGSQPYRCATSTGGTMHSWNNGAYFMVYWTASSSPGFQLSLAVNASTTSKLGCFLNGQLTDAITASGNIAFTSANGLIASAANVLVCHLRNSTQASRWNSGVNSVTVTGFQIDTASAPGVAPGYRPWVKIAGDSQSEGIANIVGALDDELLNYTFLVGQQLLAAGYDYSVFACGYNGYLVTGDGSGMSGDVPPYYKVSGGTYLPGSSRWNRIDQGVSALDAIGHESADGQIGHEPSLILINLGANDTIQSQSLSDLQAAVTGDVQAEHAAAPSAPIINLLSFGLDFTTKFTGAAPYKAALQAGTAAAAVPNASFLDLGYGLASVLELNQSVYGGDYNVSTNPYPTHFNGYGQALAAAMVEPDVNKALNPAAVASSVHRGISSPISSPLGH